MLFHLVDSAENLKLPGGRHAAHRHWIYYLLFSAYSKYLFSGSVDSKVKLWSVRTGELIRTFHGHDARISALTLSPDGRLDSVIL
jgi:WD40 repeat protein